jgi:hypothetical protein
VLRKDGASAQAEFAAIDSICLLGTGQLLVSDGDTLRLVT